jgi:uncharacterized protein
MQSMLERISQPGWRAPRSPWMAAWAAGALLALAAALPVRAAARNLPLWRVSDASGHVLYLVGSMHALKPGDYPLPAAITTAFAHSDLLVEEIDLNSISHGDVMKTVAAIGMLPPGQTLAQAMGADWQQALSLAKTAGINLDIYARSKPWFAAVLIGDQLSVSAGYDTRLGLDMHFAALASGNGMPVEGLETLQRQLQLLDEIPDGLQRKFLLQTLSEAREAGEELNRLHTAWRDGDLRAIDAIAEKDFAGYPELRKTLLTARNRRWLPALKGCLTSGKTCFVVVGAEHMAGSGGLPALLQASGDRVRQVESTSSGTEPVQ